MPFFAYSTNYLIDLQAGIIVDVEATPANRSHEVESTRTMIERVEQRRDLKPRRLVGDTAYGSAAMLAWMIEEKEIAPHVPGTHYAVTGASSGIRARVSRRLTRSSIGQASWTARAVR
ncbi:transposase [Paraburkholderia youngii]|uniref:transposase n=1 Tax=Paraburkholderia youngii TaxID=2782701 RepID=UPI003D20B10B